MPKVLIIGAGGVGAVVAHKCAQVPEVFTDIVIASRTKSRVDALARQLPRKVTTAQVDELLDRLARQLDGAPQQPDAGASDGKWGDERPSTAASDEQHSVLE